MKLRWIWYFFRYLGPGWLLFRIYYLFKNKTGVLRKRTPPLPWERYPLESLVREGNYAGPEGCLEYRRSNAPPFFFSATTLKPLIHYFSNWDNASAGPVAIADRLAQGDIRYFSGDYLQVGFPPNWHLNPLTGQEAPSDRHWSLINDFEYGDIKAIWEPSRFGFVFALVRAYYRTGDESYPQMFWRLVEDWRLHNPPNQGVNWKCGQETSFRSMAWIFGLYGFITARATSAGNVARLCQMLAVSALRIDANIEYAISQRNNHGISEALGLWTIGSLFPEFKGAVKWRDRGRMVLERLGRELVYEGGAFSQHSVNYHRLMLHDFLWCLRLGDILGRPFSDVLKMKVGQAGVWLLRLQLGENGDAPNYGQNDGALILPLGNWGYQDLRPVIQAIFYLMKKSRCYPQGPWDEDLFWLFGSDALKSEIKAPQKQELCDQSGGYYTLHSRCSTAFVRCASFKHRPGQADMLHTDIWWERQAVAIDPGTYSYNSPEPWNNPFSETCYHNTVTLDGASQMERAGKFMWLPWAWGKVQLDRLSPRGHIRCWQGMQTGYLRLKPPVDCSRAIVGLPGDMWLILDRSVSAAARRVRLHWLLHDRPYQFDEDKGAVVLQTPKGDYFVRMGAWGGDARFTLIRAEKNTPRGWHAPFYLTKASALSLSMETVTDDALFWSIFGPGFCDIKTEDSFLQIYCDDRRISVLFNPSVNRAIVYSIKIQGPEPDSLEFGL